jgi:quercetin dioxygenase-like cupin family protein
MKMVIECEAFLRVRLGTLHAAILAALIFMWPQPQVHTHAQEKQTINAQAIQHREIFRSTATVLDKFGKPRTVQMAIHRWTILGEQKIPEFQEHGFLLVQLLGGKASTVIDGREEKRSKGEFWAVPANSKMSIHTTGETASLEVTIFTI